MLHLDVSQVYVLNEKKRIEALEVTHYQVSIDQRSGCERIRLDCERTKGGQVWPTPAAHQMSFRDKSDFPVIARAMHRKLCVTEHEPGVAGFPCGDAMAVLDGDL